MALLAPGTAPFVFKPKREFELHVRVLLEARHQDRQERNDLLFGVMRECRAYQLLGDFGNDRGCRNRFVERYGAGDGVEVGEANANRRGPTRPRFGPESAGNPIRKMTQRESKQVTQFIPTSRSAQEILIGDKVSVVRAHAIARRTS
jgi:hypothetical protein